MNVLTTWLWKEWRDHRAVVVATAVALPLLTLLCEIALTAFADHPAVPAIATLVAFTIVVLALFGDVFAGEERRGTIAFLRRQPGGWWPPFAAKFLFVTLVTAVICGETFGFAELASRLSHGAARAGVDARRSIESKDAAAALAAVLLLLVAPAWTIVVSIWFPRSVVALPGAAVLLVLFATPIALTFTLNDGLEPSRAELLWTLGLLVVAAPVIAAISFARGRAVERGRWRAGVVGLVLTLALFTPGYAWTAKRACDFRGFDPLAASFHVSDMSCLSTNGRFAWVTGFHATRDDRSGLAIGRFPSMGDGPNHALCIDLVDGTWRELGGVGARVDRAPGMLRGGQVPYVVVEDPSAATRPSRTPWMAAVNRADHVLPIYDAETAALLRPDLDEAFVRASDDAGSRFQRLANDLVLPDGSRAWFDHGHLVRSTTAGGTRVLPDSELPAKGYWVGPQSHYGHGAFLDSGVMYDVLRERRFTVPDGMFVRWIHDGECIAVQGRKPFEKRCMRWNPVTRESAPIAGLAQDEVVSEMADDGRLLVFVDGGRKRRNAAGRELTLLDPRSGARESVALPECVGDWTAGVSFAARTPAGVPVVYLYSSKEQRTRYARFDLAARRFDVLAVDVTTPLMFVGCADEESAVVTDGHRLLRAWFGKPGVEVLFPKPAQ